MKKNIKYILIFSLTCLVIFNIKFNENSKFNMQNLNYLLKNLKNLKNTDYTANNINNLKDTQVLYVSNIYNNKESKNLDYLIENEYYVVQNIKEETDKYSIDIYYPSTKFEVLNTKIDEVIKRVSNNVVDLSLQKTQTESNYFININFNYYCYYDIISFVFYINTYTGAIHSQDNIFTINYNIKTNEIIDIDYLMKKNNDILNILSKYSYENLSKNESLKEYSYDGMIKEGTKAKKENFSSFVFSKNGLIVFFERYQVAPYILGEFVCTFSYDNLQIL